jgi:hypothetical protein
MIAPANTVTSIGLGFNTFTGAVLPTALSSSSKPVTLGLSSQSIVGNRDLYLGGVGPNLITLQGMRSSYEWIQSAYTAYGYTGDPTLAQNFSQLTNDINGLTNWLNGGTWQRNGFVATAVDSGCALAEFNGQLVMVFNGQNNQINLCRSNDGGSTWTAPSILSGLTSAHPPALAVFNDQLCLAFTGMDKSIYACTSSNGETFGTPTAFGTNSSLAAPTLAVAMATGHLCLGFVGQDAQLNFASSSNGTNFANQLTSGYFSASATMNAVLGAANGSVYCAYADRPSTGGSGLGVLVLSVQIGGEISVYGTPRFYDTGAIGSGLSLGAAGDSMIAAWQTTSGSIVTWNSSSNVSSVLASGSQPALCSFNNSLVLAYDTAANGINILVLSLARRPRPGCLSTPPNRRGWPSH